MEPPKNWLRSKKMNRHTAFTITIRGDVNDFVSRLVLAWMKGNLVFNAMFYKVKFDGHFIVRNLDRPHFCLLECRTLFFAIFFKYLRKFLDFFFNTEYKIVASMPARFLFYAIQLSYSSSFTFAFVRTASTMPSFLLFTPKKLMQWFISACASLTATTVKNSFLPLQHAAAFVFHASTGSLQVKTSG